MTAACATRRLIIATLVLFCLSMAFAPAKAGTYQADGTYAGTPSASVTALFAAYPNGGDGLVGAIRSLLIANPELADDVAYLASRASPVVRADAAAGMSQAFIALNNSGNANGAARIVSAAQRSNDAVIQTALTNAVGRTAAFADQSVNPATGKSNCRPPVSPSAPTTCQ